MRLKPGKRLAVPREKVPAFPGSKAPRSTDLLQTFFESRRVADVEFRGTPHRRDLCGLECADHPRRRANNQRMLRKLLAFRDHRSRAYDTAAADPRAVHDDRAHADQRAILQRAAVQDEVVTDGAVLTDRQRKTHVGVAGRLLLQIGIFADFNPLIVAGQHRAEPHACRAQQAHLADHGRSIGDEVVAVGGEFRRLPVKLIDCHASLISWWRRLWHSRVVQASSPAVCSVIRKNVPDITLQNPARMVASITNSKPRRSISAPRSVLRMMMKGAAKTRKGTAAKVFGAAPCSSNPNPAGRCSSA